MESNQMKPIDLPWKTKQRIMGLFLYDTNDRMVACPINDRTDKETNARLIVAAPEMLAMLERLEWSGEADVMGERMTFCPVCEVGYDRHDDGCDLGNLLQRIRGEQ
jgi:hypothetical protein